MRKGPLEEAVRTLADPSRGDPSAEVSTITAHLRANLDDVTLDVRRPPSAVGLPPTALWSSTDRDAHHSRRVVSVGARLHARRAGVDPVLCRLCTGDVAAILRPSGSLALLAPPDELLQRSALLDSFHVASACKPTTSTVVDVVHHPNA